MHMGELRFPLSKLSQEGQLVLRAVVPNKFGDLVTRDLREVRMPHGHSPVGLKQGGLGESLEAPMGDAHSCGV
jgi:hypothetical protein